MKRMRKIVLVLLTIWIVVLCLEGCIRDVNNDSSNYANVWCNEECINIYSPISSTVVVAITVEYSGKTITIGETVEMLEHQNKTIMIHELNTESFDENAKIVSANIIKQTHNDNTIIVFGLGVLFVLIFMAVFITILVFYFTMVVKITRFFLSFWF